VGFTLIRGSPSRNSLWHRGPQRGFGNSFQPAIDAPRYHLMSCVIAPSAKMDCRSRPQPIFINRRRHAFANIGDVVPKYCCFFPPCLLIMGPRTTRQRPRPMCVGAESKTWPVTRKSQLVFFVSSLFFSFRLLQILVILNTLSSQQYRWLFDTNTMGQSRHGTKKHGPDTTRLG
jgi:hypothetical protein